MKRAILMSSIQLVRQPVVLIAKQAVAQLCCGWSELGDGVTL